MPKGHMLSDLDHPPSGQPDDGRTVVLSDNQFQTLVDLLTPGYELSSMMLAEWQAQHAPKPAETDISAKVAADNEAATDVAKAQVPDPIPTDPPAATPEPIPDPIPPAPRTSVS